MPPPRKYIRDANRKLVNGLSIHKPSGRFYSIDDDGKRRYWGTDKPETIRRFRAHAETDLVPLVNGMGAEYFGGQSLTGQSQERAFLIE